MAEIAQMKSNEAADMNDARPRRWGWWLLILGFGGGTAWAMLAPLDAGVSANGVVVVSGNRKAVQSLVTGKVLAILANDGDEVTAGQLLVRLDDTPSQVQLQIAKGQWFAGMATEARLVAEQADLPAPKFPAALLSERTDPRASAALTLQGQLFATRRAALASELAAMGENIRGLELQLQGVEASRQAKDEQLKLLREQLQSQRDLASEGYLPRNRVLEQERAVASLVGAIAEDSGSAGRTRQGIAEAKIRLLVRQQDMRKDVETQLADTQRDLTSLFSRLETLQFDVASFEVHSPASGLVMNQAVHTVGGVVAAGSQMMEIVPKNEMLKVEAQVPPHLIDKVKPGLPVDVLFTAFSQAKTPHVLGKVVWVSADVLIDPKQGSEYFKAWVEVTPDGLKSLKSNEIRAGMPAEVFVRTGERTAMNYLLKPLLDRFNRALSEP
jgi:protease secretion system membrane fusion protein